MRFILFTLTVLLFSCDTTVQKQAGDQTKTSLQSVKHTPEIVSKQRVKEYPPVMNDPVYESYRKRLIDPTFGKEFEKIITLPEIDSSKCKIFNRPLSKDLAKYNMEVNISLLKGKCKSGKLSGPAVIRNITTSSFDGNFTKNTAYLIGIFRRGKQKGEFKQHMISETTFKEPIFEDMPVLIIKSHALINFRNGVPVGKSASYTFETTGETKNSFTILKYKNGKINGEWRNFTGSKLFMIMEYKDGKLHGNWKMVVSKDMVDYYKKTGARIVEENGIFFKVEKYKHGKVVGGPPKSIVSVGTKPTSQPITKSLQGVGDTIQPTAESSRGVGDTVIDTAADCLKKKAAAEACKLLPWPANMFCPKECF